MLYTLWKIVESCLFLYMMGLTVVIAQLLMTVVVGVDTVVVVDCWQLLLLTVDSCCWCWHSCCCWLLTVVVVDCWQLLLVLTQLLLLTVDSCCWWLLTVVVGVDRVVVVYCWQLLLLTVDGCCCWLLFLLTVVVFTCPFKGAVSRDFRTLFFSLIKPIWAPDKQAKMVFLKNLFSRRYSNLKFEKFDSASAQANTARSWNFSTS